MSVCRIIRIVQGIDCRNLIIILRACLYQMQWHSSNITPSDCSIDTTCEHTEVRCHHWCYNYTACLYCPICGSEIVSGTHIYTFEECL